MKLLWKILPLIGLLVPVVLVTSCVESYDASIKLDSLIKLDSARFGHLNSVFVATGDIINLNPTTKTGTRVGHIDASTINTVEADTFDSAAGNSIDVSFTGNVPTGDLKIALTTTITNSTALNLTNPSAIEIGDIVTPLNDATNDHQLDPLFNAATQNGETLVIVTKLIKADDLKFTFQGATQISSSVSQLKIGNYALNVNYTDNTSLEQAAQHSAQRNTGVFFKVAKIIKGLDGKYVPENTNDLNLGGYNLADTLH